MLDVPAIGNVISAAVDEDYRDGDVTSRLCFPEDVQASAEIIAREDLVVCGFDIVDLIIGELGFDVEATYVHDDGEVVEAGTTLVELFGSAYELLAMERITLNFLQRLTGVASLTAEYVKAAGHITVLDTRKTLPGWRYLDKYATRAGGARNHRMNLSDMVLIKDTHIDAAGGLETVLEQVQESRPFYTPVEVEVRTIEELKTVLSYSVNAVMLDNMDNDTIREAIELVGQSKQSPAIEVSGGITLERLKELQEFKGIAVSIGAITTRALNKDIAMEVVLQDE